MLIHLEKLGKSFGEKIVLHDVTASVEREDRIGIVGQNGAGKTTLLKILTGEYTDYEGEFSVTHGVTLGYLEQNAKLDPTLDIYGEMRSCFAHVLDAMAQMQILERRMAASPEDASLLEQHDALQNIIDAADGYNMDVNIKKVLSGMGFAQDTWTKNIAVLSGGELTRLRLAKLLLEKPDVLILDEPTNHLDFATMEWLENYLKGYSGAVLVVSHDRYFLDNICTRIWEVSFQTMATYKGNFSAYLPQKEAADALRQKQHDADVALAEKLQDYVDRNLVRASTTKMAQSRRKQLEKLEITEAPKDETNQLKFRFEYDVEPWNELVLMKNLTIRIGERTLLEPFTYTVCRGQRLVIAGPNGAGKSTLLKTLAGQLAPLGGTVLLDGQDLTAYTGTARAQKLALMLPHTRRTELTTCFEFAAAGRIPYTGRLGILSDADRQAVQDALEIAGAAHLADRDFNCISDGQRQRVFLARAICQQPKVLLLDEPTSFLDIKGKIELLTILQKLAHEQGLAVIVSLHELDMAQKIADAVVCVFPDHVSGVLTPDAAFAPDNIRALYALSDEQYTALFGQAKPQKPTFEHYVRSGQKLLRCGYTTGTCAALGAAGAARLLLTGHAPETVALRTPKGIVVAVAPLFCRRTDTGAECAIEKDGGDDVDVTTGLPVIATVELLPGCTDIRIDGGRGVGRVTKPGLDQPVGAAAINHVPRQMIAEALRREAEAACYTGGFAVTISIQNGEEVARRTFNPHIGVEGGLSVLGTSGIVEPMSQQAILDTIQLEMNQAVLRAGTPKRLILAPGNYGLDYLHDTYPAFAAIPVVKTSNFIGDTLDMAASAGFEQVLLVGHVGKLVKVAGGIMNTHSHTADCRTELFCAHAALCGASRELCAALYAAATTDACLELLDTAGLRAPVLESLLDAIQLHLDRRAGEAFRVGAVLFSNQHGPLGATQTAKELLEQWNNA